MIAVVNRLLTAYTIGVFFIATEMLKYWTYLKQYKYAVFMLLLLFIPHMVFSQTPGFGVATGPLAAPQKFSSSINLLLSLSSITLVPFFLISTTSFLRMVIVLTMLRNSFQSQQTPPAMATISLALFLTLFVMTPTWNQINENAVKPYQAEQMDQKQAFEEGAFILKRHMLKFSGEKDLALFLEFSKLKPPKNHEEIPVFVVIPAYIISEVKAAFKIGFLLYVPFVIIDLIVSNILLSLGMFMLSPTTLSLPFKILLLVLTDGWHLIVQGLMLSVQ